MTRAERLAEQEAKAKAKRDNDHATYRAKRSARLAEEKHQRRKRHSRVGRLADDAGLLALSDADLAGLFAAFAPLTHVPHPVAVMASLLADGVCPALGSVDGRADLTVVSALRADLALAR